jgi:hypothetical protein
MASIYRPRTLKALAQFGVLTSRERFVEPRHVEKVSDRHDNLWMSINIRFETVSSYVEVFRVWG